MVHVEACKALLKLSSPFETLLHWTFGVQRLIRARTVQMVLILSLNLYIITFIVRVWPELGIILTLSQPVLIYDVVSLSVCIMPASLLSRWPWYDHSAQAPNTLPMAPDGPCRKGTLLAVCARLILLRILEGKAFISKLPIASGLTEILTFSHLSLSISLAITYFFLLPSQNPSVLVSHFAVSNNVFHPAVKQILQRCLKFPKDTPFPPTITKWVNQLAERHI